jgi:hypothetical protein
MSLSLFILLEGNLEEQGRRCRAADASCLTCDKILKNDIGVLNELRIEKNNMALSL